MTRYLVAFVLLAAGGILLLAFNCAPMERSDYPFEISKASLETRTVCLSETEESEVSWLVRISWKGMDPAFGEAVIVDKRAASDFLVLDTLSPLNQDMSFEDSDTSDTGSPVAYRLLLLNQGLASELETIVRPPITGVVFNIPDTVVPSQDSLIKLAWEPLADEASYEVELMTLETLAPYPKGRRVASATLKRSGSEPVRWIIDASRLSWGANYILQVNVTMEDSVWSRTVTGSRLFVLGNPPKTEENK